MKYVLTDGVEFTRELFADIWHGTDGVDAKACEFPERNRVLLGYSQNDGIDYFRKPEFDKEYVSSDGSYSAVKEYYQANNGNDFYTYVDEDGFHHILWKDGVTATSEYYDYLEEPDVSGEYDPGNTNGRDSILVKNCDKAIPKDIIIYGNARINSSSNKIEGLGVLQDAPTHNGNYMIPVAISRQNLLPSKYFPFFTESTGWKEEGSDQEMGNLPPQIQPTDIWEVRKIGEVEYSAKIDTTFSGDFYRSLGLSEKHIPITDVFSAGYGKYTIIVDVTEGSVQEGGLRILLACIKGDQEIWYFCDVEQNITQVKKVVELTEDNTLSATKIPFDGSCHFSLVTLMNEPVRANLKLRISIVKGDFENSQTPEYSSCVVSNYTSENVDSGPVSERITRYFALDALYKLGNSADSISIPSGKITRRTKKITTGINDYGFYDGESLGEFWMDIPDIKSGGDAIFSAYEKTTETVLDKQYKIDGSRLIVKDSDFSGEDGMVKFNESCADQRLEILYEIEEQEEDIVGVMNPIYFDEGNNFVFIKDTYGALEGEYLNYGQQWFEPVNIVNTERSKVFGETITNKDVGMILHYPVYPSKMSVSYYRI